MRVRILGCGTSTGVPIPGCKCEVCSSDDPRNKRLRTSALIEMGSDFSVLIDSSTDLRQQALKWGVRRVDSVLYTHAHADHILGIDDLRAFNFVLRKDIPCFGEEATLEHLRQMFSYIFSPDPAYQGGLLPKLSLHPIRPYEALQLGGNQIMPIRLMHGELPVLGFRIGDFAYATDCNSIPSESITMLQNLDTLVLDGLRFEPHSTHFTIPDAVQMAKELGAKKTYLTHMTHSIDYQRTQAELPPGIELAYDGLIIEI